MEFQRKFLFINISLAFGALYCLLAVIFSSLTSHLPDQYFINDGRNMSRIADNILFIHGLALISVSILQKIWKLNLHFFLIGCIFILGLTLFCSGVFYISFTGFHPFLPIAPIGGTLLIFGWLYLAILALFLK
ncbi:MULTISPECIES: DUF423 domain-containing protein [Commensalibacter]|uniref:DUF423 domain-containing protein n=1 Tax=Commensalibacter melissae TaxID=2070537 RepID=A0A318N191_9PROT|nr:MULTISPECIES: DUF423 domain-containing protein [Commensalibacter]MCT6852505.1 DUF423 domain-containing protein [Commensalibacter sp.]MBH9972603.1 DUF423 domain-containing protein [Commensalibacter melissae]MBI0016865.1 DUF423 domain-containing protein [Commensalibacter sp. B14384M2]MBI0018610.1 DUF423 domain-containing protein [Commensalibacter sp. W8133]MBI0050008.1 DUF423 domain-containing protein [Commensalibacter sp. B14384M3]